MKQIATKAIVLTRTNYGEADRILTLITPSEGKLRLIAKGVRKPKSKLAGGVELFSSSDITFIRGRGDIGTLVSARLDKHFGTIVQDVERTMLAYDILKQIHKATEDEPEQRYYELTLASLGALDDAAVPSELIRAWFGAQLLACGGYTPELKYDVYNQALREELGYVFDYDKNRFKADDQGRYTARAIKFLRLLFAQSDPKRLCLIEGAEAVTPMCAAFVAMLVRESL